MRPILFEIPLPGGGHLPLHGYGLMIAIGFFLAAGLASSEFRRRCLPDLGFDLGLSMLLAGLVGGRIFFYIENYEEKFASESFLEFFKIWKGGLVFYGGALGGSMGGLFYCWKNRLSVADGFDCVAPAVPIGMAFGRLGCFLNGCCFGGVCSPGFLLGVTFPVDSGVQAAQWDAGLLDSPKDLPLPVHPVQLYQAAHDFLLCALVLWYLRRPTTPRGSGIPLLFFLYGIGRFCLEALRWDNPITPTGLTISQNLSVGLVLASGTVLCVLLVSQRAGLGRPAKKPVN